MFKVICVKCVIVYKLVVFFKNVSESVDLVFLNKWVFKKGFFLLGVFLLYWCISLSFFGEDVFVKKKSFYFKVNIEF